MRKTVVPGVSSWSRWQPDRGLDFNSFFVETVEGNLVVDPLEPDAETLAELRERGVAAVLVTNRDHERFTAAVVEATGAQVITSALDAPLLSHRVDRTVVPGDTVFGWTVVGLDGFKTAGEIALYSKDRRAAIVGDALWGSPAGALTLMPDAKLADPSRAALSARKLRALDLDHVLVGDGACIFGNAHGVIGAMLDAREGILVNRVNVDELEFVDGHDGNEPFGDESAEVGLMIGAEKLGYRVARLRRGDHFCPYHWHTAEEELFAVLAGTPSLRTPRGTFPLRAGDIIAFPTNSGGAHKIWNDAETVAVILMVANTNRADTCFYPDSDKHVVEATGTLVRNTPQLDYFDGER